MTMCDDIRSRLDAWIDQELDAQEADEVRRHLGACPQCRGLADDLARLRSAAGELGPIAPPAHIWLEVAGQIRIDAGTASPSTREPRGRRAQVQWLGLAAALVIVTIGLWMLGRTAPPETAPVSAEASGADLVTAELDLAVEHYERAIATLESMAAAGDLPVEPAVTATLRENLGVVDAAIAESRQALEQDPTNQSARDSLFDSLRQKVGLLQATVALMNEIRKGDPGAALSATGSGMSL